MISCVVEVAPGPAEALRRMEQRIMATAIGKQAPGYTASRWHGSSGDFDSLIADAAARCGLELDLVRAVVAVESGFRPDAVSPAGAKGLMQLMDGTAARLGVVDPFDPVENLRGGTAFLRHLLDRFGDERLALAAYNAGPGAVERFGSVPPYAETQQYVRAVLAEREALRSWRG